MKQIHLFLKQIIKIQLHPNFVDFVRKAKELDFYVIILSNLTLLNDEMIEAMKYKNACSVQVSLYSMIPEHHDAITTIPGSFEKTKAAILKLIKNDIPVQISCPTMKINRDDYRDVMKWAHKHKVRAITDYSIMAEYNHDTSNLENRLEAEECGKVINDILEEDIDYQGMILDDEFMSRIDNYKLNPEAQICGVGISACCMVANGNIYPCPGWQSYNCGNLYEYSLEEIWNNSSKMNYLRGLRNKDLKKCMNCKYISFCRPCMVRNSNESKNGNPLEINPYFCEVAKINRNLVLKWRENKLKNKNNKD